MTTYGPRQPTPDEQLDHWLDGRSYCPNGSGECCPDFSCCNPDLLAPANTRRLFVEGDARVREHLCMGFLGSFVATMSEPELVHIAGLVPEGDVH